MTNPLSVFIVGLSKVPLFLDFNKLSSLLTTPELFVEQLPSF